MQSRYGKTQSLWMRQEGVPQFPALDSDINTDVCVVGAGIAGLTTALLLLQDGHSVVVVEAGVLSGGETSRTTAHLSFALDDRYYELERLFGERGARTAHESHAKAVDKIEQMTRQEGIECDFTRLDGYLFAPPDEPKDELDRELHAARRAGLIVERLDSVPIESLRKLPCLRFPNQGQFNPLQFTAGLAKSITRLGGKIYTKSRVSEVHGGSRPEVATFSGMRVRANAVVVATNSPIHSNLTIHTRQGPYRTYAIGAEIPRNAIPRALYWDTLESYHYVRLQSAHAPADAKANDVLIVGGEDHRQGEAEDENEHFQWLEDWTRKYFPVREITSRWSGMVLEPADSLGLIGPDNAERNVYIATGDSGHGMTHGVIASMLLTDLISGRENPWADLYDPRRVTGRAASEYISENASVAANLASWLTPGDVSGEDDVEPGTGAIVRSGLAKHAVYRDEYGSVFTCSAVCPHLGCIVAWNAAEKTWDCPCHGSRFDTRGKVLRGPSTTGLEAIS